MKRTKEKYRVLLVAALVISMLIAFAGVAYGASSSVTVKPSGKTDNTDVKRITNALKKYKTVKLKKGKKYYLETPIHARSNRTLIATGATIVSKDDVITCDLNKADYSNVVNFTVKGGTWKSKSKEGYKRTSIRFVHGANIKLMNMTIKHPSYNGHAIELVGCKDVLVDNVKIIPQGTAKKSVETMLQIDIATTANYPRFSKKPSLSNGAVCDNIVIQNCTITGNKAVAAGFDKGNKQGFINSAHTNIQILNNKLVGKNAEALFLPNVKNAVVSGNYIESDLNNSTDNAIGCHFLVAGNISDTSFTCTNNTIKGGKYALRVWPQLQPEGVLVGSTVITGNACYCKAGAGSAIQAASKGITENGLTLTGNSTYKW